MKRKLCESSFLFNTICKKLIALRGNRKGFRDWISAFTGVPAFINEAWKANRSLIMVGISLRLLYSLMPIMILFVSKLVIDEVIAIVQNHHHDLTKIVVYIALDFLLNICSSFLNRTVQANNRLVSEFYANHSSLKLMEHASRLELEQFENTVYYDKMHRARKYTPARVESLIEIFDQMQDTFTFLFLLAGIVMFSPWLVLLLIVTSVPSLLSEFYFNKETFGFIKSSTEEQRELDYLCELGTSNLAVKEIKIFGLSKFFIRKFRNLSGRHYKKKKEITYKRTRWSLFFVLLSSLGYYGSYILVISSTLKGSITIGELTFFFGSFECMKELLEVSFDRLAKIAQSVLHIQDYFDFFKIEPALKISLKGRPFPKPVLFGYTFDNVGFMYKGSEKWVIRNLNLNINPREKIALVGENGAGKTTISKLLCRLYDPTEGTIYLDGHDLREYDLEDLRKASSVVFQDFNKYDMTIAGNIGVGKIEQRDNLRMIKYAAYQSKADQFIEKLPSRYDQRVGKKFSKGVELSGGQWQKLALARAFMRNAQLVILDEPSAALDPQAEYDLFQRYMNYSQNKIVVLISHRFSNVRFADRILVLKNGRCVEMGNHHELIYKKGLYAEMFNIQAQGYR